MKAAASAGVFKNFINGEWVAPKSGKTHENRNPANTDEIIGEFPLSSEADVEQAVAAARAAYAEWRLMRSSATRKRISARFGAGTKRHSA